MGSNPLPQLSKYLSPNPATPTVGVARSCLVLNLSLDTVEDTETSDEACITLVGRGGALVETMTFNRRVVDSTPALAAT